MKTSFSREHLWCTVLAVLFSAGSTSAQLPNPPQPAAQPPGASPLPSLPQSSSGQQLPSVLITIEQAIDLAKKNNPGLLASQTLIQQSKAQEITANLRPNPLLSWDAQFLPIFDPSLFSSDYINETAQFDLGVGYLFERGKKRQRRLQAARDVTAVTESQVADTERTLTGSVTQQFVAALLAKANLEFALQILQSYRHTVGISDEKYKAGGISKFDDMKIRLQMLQFEMDVEAARIAKVQALASLRQLLGFDSVPRNYDVAGNLVYEPLPVQLDALQAKAVTTRPDLQAAQRGIASATSQVALARANAKQDLTATFDYSHVNAASVGSFFFNIPLPIFNRNQGEIARTQYALTQSQLQERAAEQQVMTDVTSAYEVLRNSEEVVQLYEKGYLEEAKESLDIAQFSYQHGAASLLDFLDAERSYRSTELNYRQALATYMSALEQLRLAVGTRDLQ